MKNKFEAHKHDWLVQAIHENGDIEDFEMYPEHEHDKAVELSLILRYEGFKNVRVVHPSKESFENLD